jgi:hypothetical protein
MWTKESYAMYKHLESIDEDSANEFVCNMINMFLEIPGITNAVIAAIPDDYEANNNITGDDVTKNAFAFSYIWDLIFSDEGKEA